MRIAFYGDSITAGIPGASYVDKIRCALPQHTVRNYGKINDTPLSLHHRIQTKSLARPVDVAFILVGVNDLLIERSWMFSRIRQRWARDDVAFRQHYDLLLGTVCAFANRVVCISPLFIGEDFSTPPQQKLGIRAEVIAELTDAQPNAEYLDIRTTFMDALRSKVVTTGIPQNLIQSVWDGLTRRNDVAVTQISAERGLHYTIDGVHLNAEGAKIVATGCLNVLRRDEI